MLGELIQAEETDVVRLGATGETFIENDPYSSRLTANNYENYGY